MQVLSRLSPDRTLLLTLNLLMDESFILHQKIFIDDLLRLDPVSFFFISGLFLYFLQPAQDLYLKQFHQTSQAFILIMKLKRTIL